MKLYETISGIKVYAASPDNASVEFCREAEKSGIYLYEAKKFNPDKIEFETTDKFFAKINSHQILATGKQVLILSANENGLTGTTQTGYGVLNPTAFEKWYKLIDNTSENTKPILSLQNKSFYLDAGHGGSDPGAVNDNLGLQEKIAALDVCLKIGKILEKQGAKIYYSRLDNDSRPSLSARADEANNKNVTAYISIHLNSAENKSAQGIETLVYSTKVSAYDLAVKVQRNMVEATGWTNRGVKERPGLTVLKKTKMPAILCEIGFISNNEQAKELFKNEVQDKLAYAIASGIIEEYKK